MKKVTIAVIPAHNESKCISKIVEETRRYVDEVIVVDDGSTDDTLERALECGAIVCRNERKMGMWAALRKGFSIALNRGANIVVTLDGDGQHDPKEIPKFLLSLSNGIDVVLGVRKFDDNMPLIRQISNWLTTLMINSLFPIKVSDSQCGYRAYNRRALSSLSLTSVGFEGATESLIKLGSADFQISEIPIETIYGAEKSKMNAIRDTWRFLKTIFKLKMENLSARAEEFL